MPATSLAGVAVPKIQDEESRHAQILSTLGILWLTGSAIGLFCMFAGWCQVAVLTRRCTPLEDTEWCLLLNDAARRTRLRRPVRLLVGKGVALPMTWGAWRPVILLPEQARAWPDKRRSLVLLHELAHVQRCDWLMQILACFSCAICWYNPLVWYAMQRMRLEREQACDDIVLKHDALPSEYAHELLQYALGFQEGRLLDWATVPMARRGSLECRLLAILDPHRNRAGLMGRNCWRICPGD
jgi:beta-lactamase regulating signal transducer with metallopeptidase domain